MNPVAAGTQRRASIARGALALPFAIACVLSCPRAQDPPKTTKPPAQKTQDPKKKTPGPVRPLPIPDKVVDPAKAAAEAMKKGEAPKTPPGQDPPAQDPPKQDPKQARPQGKPPAPKTQEETEAKPTKPVQPLPGKDKPVDPAQSASEALKAALPGAEQLLEPPATKPQPTQDPKAAPQVDPTREQDPQDPGPVRPLPAQPDPSEPGPRVSADAGRPPLLRGSFRTRYRFRDATNGNQDQDVQSLLSFDIGDGRYDPISAHFYGLSWWDIDGQNQPNVFSGIEETYDGNVQGRLYEAYADFHEVPGTTMARLGRQALYETPVILYLDGARVETERYGEMDFWAGGYFGAPTRFFRGEASPDLIGGLMAGVRPWQGARLRFDWLAVQDDRSLTQPRSDVIALGLWQNLGDTNLHGRFSWLDGRSRDLLLRADTWSESLGLQIQGSYYESLTTIAELPVELEPFFALAFEYRPYRQFGLNFSKTLGEHADLQAGVDLRRLDEREEEAQFNREYERYFVVLDTRLPSAPEHGVSLYTDWWDSSGEEILAFGGDFRTELRRDLTATLGTSFSRFQFDGFTAVERERVRAYFLRFDHEIDADLHLDLDYSYERDDQDEYHVVRTGVTWTF